MVFDLRAEVELDEAGLGAASSGCVQEVRRTRTIVWAPSLMPRNLYEVGISISVP